MDGGKQTDNQGVEVLDDRAAGRRKVQRQPGRRHFDLDASPRTEAFVHLLLPGFDLKSSNHLYSIPA